MTELTTADWDKAKEHLDFVVSKHKKAPTGLFKLSVTLFPLCSRYRIGERTQKLYDEIMECE